MFDNDIQIRGKHATYWKALSQLPGNAVGTTNNFKIFENYIYVYMVAPIIGLINGRKAYTDPKDDSKDTAGMLSEVQIKNSAKLKYIYRLIILCDDSEGLSDEERINWAFKCDDNADFVKKGMALYNAYFFGGLEILYDEFINNCTTDDDYIRKMYEFVNIFYDEQKLSELTLDIEQLLRR